MSSSPAEPWSIVARNLPDHANNPIHTDAGARAQGFERALVAGVTTYAYLCHPVSDRWGLDWVALGASEVRFRSPVFDGDTVLFPVTDRDDGGIDVDAVVERSPRPLVTMSAWSVHRAPFVPRDGERLETVSLTLEGEYGSGYADRAGDGQRACLDAGAVHPAVWPALGNYVFHRQVVRGSWIHTRSIVRHHALVPEGSVADIATTVVERFQRSGERAIADVVITVDGAVVASIEHEAIIDLASR